MILKRIQHILASKLFLAGICALTLLIVNWSLLVSSLNGLRPPGNDSVGHYEIGMYYAEHIFPSVWGWVPHLYGGMPFPQYYPPLFFFLTALLYKITPFSYVHIFEWVMLLLTLSIPALTALIARRYSGKAYSGWFAGGISILLMSLFYNAYGNLGITIQSTYGVGLVPQLLGFVCLLLWLYFFLEIEKSRWNWSFSMLFLFLTFLSNAHIVPTACIIFSTIFIYHFYISTQKKSLFILYFSAGFIPTLAVSFWYLPMLSHFTYMAGRSLGYDNDFESLLLRSLTLIVLTIFAFIIGWKRKDQSLVGFSLSLLIIGIAVFLRLDKLIPRLPVHTLRSLAPIFLLAPIAADVVITAMLGVMKIRERIIGALVLTIVLGLSFSLNGSFNEFTPIFSKNEFDKLSIQNILDYMSDKEGMVNVETVHSGRVLNSYISEVATTNHKLALSYNVIAESAISAFFMIPIRGYVSLRGEIMPVDSYLSYYRDRSIRKNDSRLFDTALKQAQELGIQYFFVASPDKVDQFSKNKQVELEKDFGFWKLFSTTKPIERVRVLSYEPILLFSEVNFKKRDLHSYDFVEFQEALFSRSLFDLTIVNPHDEYIDTSEDLTTFSTALISRYSYKDLKKAEDRLIAYVQHNTLILLADDDPLFHALKNYPSDNIRIFYPPRNKNNKDHTEAEKVIDDVLLYLDDTKKIIPEAKGVQIALSAFVEDSISIKLATSTSAKVPILIRSSYYPAWKDVKEGGSPYLATPTFMLAYADDEIQLEFKTPPSVYIGYALALVAIFLFIGMYKKFPFSF